MLASITAVLLLLQRTTSQLASNLDLEDVYKSADIEVTS